MKAVLYVLLASAVLMFGIALFMGGGCTPVHPTVPAVPTTATPQSLTHVATGLDVMILLGLLAAGVGLGLFFALPEAHRLSITLAAVGGGVGITALLIRVSLWFIPWLAVGLLVVSLAVFAYEVYRNRAKLEAKFGLGTDASIT